MNVVHKMALLGTLLASSLAVAEPAEMERPITVVNGTRAPVLRLYAATAKYDGKDAPGTLVANDLKLAPAGTATVKVKMSRGECVFNFRAETGGGDVRVYNFDICARNAKLTLSTSK